MKLPILTPIVNRLSSRKAASGALNCAAVEALLPLYVDTMDVESSRDAAGLETHLDGCPSCHGEYESLTGLRTFLRSAQRPSAPARLDGNPYQVVARPPCGNENGMGTFCGFAGEEQFRVLRSECGCGNGHTRGTERVGQYGFIWRLALGLVSNQSAIAHHGPDPSLQTYKRAQPTESTKAWLVGSEDEVEELKEPPLLVVFVHGDGLQGADEMELLKEPLQLEVYVGADGYVQDFRVVEGVQTRETELWVWDRLYWARFSPGTSFGVPVNSSVLVSFVALKSYSS